MGSARRADGRAGGQEGEQIGPLAVREEEKKGMAVVDGKDELSPTAPAVFGSSGGGGGSVDHENKRLR